MLDVATLKEALGRTSDARCAAAGRELGDPGEGLAAAARLRPSELAAKTCRYVPRPPPACAVSPPTGLQPGPGRTVTRTDSGYEWGHVGGRVRGNAALGGRLVVPCRESNTLARPI
jgi:hypothetical protein